MHLRNALYYNIKNILKLLMYSTIRSKVDHVHVFSCIIELAVMSFARDSTRTKKQA